MYEKKGRKIKDAGDEGREKEGKVVKILLTPTNYL